ncbi:hypothetical protein IMZ31_13650 [Pontibacillus sp. ALD_SL1]|uniref:hypothetical protein n=1 Tax=Pontibacillus sp. ALD_SL1 TaxID=2777185 RepID=UPI001A97B603|nr:hypothetical protein [Pontibacillus sp. ALD_SL1]QSS99120.1 hypothetical protein IMZ31_13650 [Pontibacillus sp. ALD_SL1]
MAGYIGALIAIGILLIGVSYIPIHMDRKGKLYLIGASALIALATYASKVTFTWWQSSLILVLLAFLLALLLNRRLQQFILVRDTGTSVSNEPVHKGVEDIEPVALSKDDEMKKEKSDSIISSTVEGESLSDDSKEEEVLQEELSDVAPDLEEEPSDLDVIIEEEPLNTDKPVVSPEEELLAARSDWVEGDGEEIEDVQEDAFVERSSILEVIEEDYTEEDNVDRTVEDSAPEWVDQDDVLEPVGEMDEEEFTLRDEVLEDFESLASEDVDQEEVEVEGQEVNESGLSAFEMVEHIEDEQDALEEEAPLERESSKGSATPLKSVFQTQMLHTLVEEVMVQEEILSSHNYEQYVKQFLQPSLPAQDYYTFASLLVQHHIRNQNYQELDEWLPELMNKFSDYPIIKEELQYIKDFAKEHVTDS